MYLKKSGLFFVLLLNFVSSVIQRRPKKSGISTPLVSVSQGSHEERIDVREPSNLKSRFKATRDSKPGSKKLGFIQLGSSQLVERNNIESGTPEQFLPNPMDVSKDLLSNMQSSIKTLPSTFMGSPEELRDSLNQLKKGLAVSGSYAALVGLMGVKPTENNDNGEYRRVTQVPSIVYNLTKNGLGSVKQLFPNFLMDPPEMSINQELKRLNDSIDRILNNERELELDTKKLTQRGTVMVSQLDNPSAKGKLGIGNDIETKAMIIKEKANTLFGEGNQKHFFTPIYDRDALINVLQSSFPSVLHVGRTYKTSPVPFGEVYSGRGIKKESFSDLLRGKSPLESVRQFIKEQATPQKLERMDTL